MEQVVMNTRHPPARYAPICDSHQRGVVLFIALIVMVAMSLAAIALMRSVDTTSAVIGNLAFRQASILPANYGIEDAAAGLFYDVNPANIARIVDVRVDTPTENYYATHSQAAGWDDQSGVPQPLQTKAAAVRSNLGEMQRAKFNELIGNLSRLTAEQISRPQGKMPQEMICEPLDALMGFMEGI